MPERGSKTSTVPVVWANFGNFFRRGPNDFLSRLVTMAETWLYHYDPETKQQSVEWRHSGSPRPNKFRVQKSAGKVLASIFGGIKTVSSSLITFQRAKLWTRSITDLCWCNWRTFWRKIAAGSSRRGSCSCTTMPRLPGHLQKKQAYLGFQCLDHPPYSPKMAPSDYHLFPGPSLVAVACFLPGRAKDLSAPLFILWCLSLKVHNGLTLLSVSQ